MKLFILSINLLILIISINATKNCTSDLAKEADDAFTKVVLYGDRSFTWGTTVKDIENICKSIKSNEKKVKKYLKNCVTGLSQQLIGLILKGTSNQIKKFCLPSKLKDMVKHTKCANANLEKDHLCMNEFVLTLKNAATYSDDDIKLDVSCCSFIKFEQCIVKRMKNETKCNKEDIEVFQSLVHGVGSEIMDLVCLQYSMNPSKCDEINNKLENEKEERLKANEDQSKINEDKSKTNDDKSKTNDDKSKTNDDKSNINEEKSEFTGKSIMLPLISLVKNIS